MTWPFGSKKAKRDTDVTRLDDEARAGQVRLVEKIMELDRRRHHLDRLTASALDELERSHNV